MKPEFYGVIIKDEGKRRLGINFDMKVTPAYKAYYSEQQLTALRTAAEGMREALEKCSKPEVHPMLTGLQHEADHGRRCIRIASEALAAYKALGEK